MGKPLKFFSSSIFVTLCAIFVIIFFNGCEVPTRENFNVNRVIISDIAKGQTFISEIENATPSASPKTITPDSNVQTLAYIGDALRNKEATSPSVMFELDLTQLKITQLYADFAGCKNLKTVKIKTDILNMEAGVFENCVNLENISYNVLRQQHTTIPTNAFKGCTNLIEIPKVNTSYSYNIGQGAFYDCNVLTNATILEAITRTPDTAINPTAFYGTGITGTFEIPANVTSIGSGAFGGTKVTSVTFASSSKLTTLGGFADCEQLTTVNITNATKLTTLDSRAFDGCSKLTNVDSILAKVTNVGSYAFSHCSALTSVTLQSTTPISEGMFSGSGLRSVTIPSGVTSIAASAFEKCTALTSVTIPASITTISANAFSGCSNLATIKYTGTVEQWTSKLGGVASNAFSGVTATKITCSNGDAVVPN